MTSSSGVSQAARDAGGDPVLVLPGTSLNEVAVGRRFVRDHVEGRLPDRTAHQMALATSELVTNALMHGSPGPVELVLHVNDAVAWVRIASGDGSSQLPPVNQWNLADLDAITGRGLGIVKAVSGNVEIEHHGAQLAITACFDLPGR